MKKLLYRTSILSSLLFCLFLGTVTQSARADQSGPTIQLNPAISLWTRDLSSQMIGKSCDLPQILSSGSNIHALWKADSIGVRYIVYTRSTDNGVTWQEPRVIFSYPTHTGGGAFDGGDILHKMTVSGSSVHVFLEDYNTRQTWYGRLAYLRSTDNGASFEAARYIFDANDAFHVRNIIPRSVGSKVFVCFLHKCNWASIDTCYVMSSNDNGTTFRKDSVYTSGSGGGTPDDYWTDGTRHVVAFSWAYFYYGFQEGEQFVAVSNGATINFKITRVSVPYSGKHKVFMSLPVYAPSRIAVAGSNVYVLGYDYPTSAYGRLYINRSVDNGANFSQITVGIDSNKLSQDQTDIAASGSYVYVASVINTNRVILFSSSNSGQSFGSSVDATTGGNTNVSLVAGSAYPKLFIDPLVANGSTVHIAHHAGRYAYSDDGGKNVKSPVMIFPFSLRTWRWFDVCMDAQGFLHYAQAAGDLYTSSANTDVDVWYRRYSFRSNITQQGNGNRCLLLENKQAMSVGDHQKDFVQIPCTDTRQLAGSFSIEFRFKYFSGSAASFPIIIKPAGDNHTTGTYHFSLSNGAIVASVRPIGQAAVFIYTPEALLADQWYHVAMTVDTSSKSSNVKLYLNGTVLASASTAAPMMTSYDPHSIGFIYDNAYTVKSFAIDELHLWRRALTQTELLQTMNAAVPLNSAGLVGSFSFDGTMADRCGIQGNGVPMYKESFVPCSDSIFFVARCAPATAGNTGDITLSIVGGGFSSNVKAQLRNDTTLIPAAEIRYISKTEIEATFDLRGARIAKWSLDVWNVSDTASLTKSLDVRQGEIPRPWISLHGRNLFLVNRWQNFTIYVGNTANVDATGVPIWLALTNSSDVDIEFVDFSIEWSEYAKQKGYDQQLASLPTFITINKMRGISFDARVYPLYLARVPANSVVAYHVRIRSKSIRRVDMQAWVNPPFFQSPFNAEIAQCMVSSVTERLVDNTITAIPAVGCVYAVGKLFYNPFNSYKGPGGKRTVLSTVREVGGTMLDCGVNLSGIGALATGFVKFISDLDQYVNDISDCKKRFARNGQYDGLYDIVGSIDPNSINGPPGVGSERYTSADQRYAYSVFFENKSSASAPAHQVVVLDTLEKDRFDLSTFRFACVSIADTTVNFPNSADAVSTLIDLRPKRNVIVRVDASLDAASRVIQWSFTSLDPVSLQPTDDPLGGFLPPNKNAPEGEGMVSYIVSLNPYIQHKTSVNNTARIVFDQNEAILTNTYVNTIDRVAPQSKVTSLAISNDTTLSFQWSSSDDGSGVSDVQVWMSVRDSAYQPIVGSVGDAAAYGFYQKGTGRSFRFYTVARDKVGNEEGAPSYPDLSDVTEPIELPLVPTILSIQPHPVRTTAVAVLSLPQTGPIRVTLSDMLGNERETLLNGYTASGIYELPIDSRGLSTGMYILSIADGRHRTFMMNFIVLQE